MYGIGMQELLLILVIVVLIFGSKKLPEIGGGLGKAIMKEAGFTVGRTAVVAVEVDDKPGGLNNILEALSGQNVNVEYMYAFVQEGGGSATMIFRFDRIDQAIEVLKAKNIPIIPADRING